MCDSWLNTHLQIPTKFRSIVLSSLGSSSRYTPYVFSAIDLDIRQAFFIAVRFSPIFHELLLGLK
jgi:hypothetical protein